jgi:hypothetical protein
VSAGALVALLLGLGAVAFVLWPLLRGGAHAEVESAVGLGAARELQSRRDMLLAALKDLEDDRATDKIDEADYAELHAKLSDEAVRVLKSLDDLEREREEAARRPLARTLKHPAARAKGPAQ